MTTSPQQLHNQEDDEEAFVTDEIASIFEDSESDSDLLTPLKEQWMLFRSVFKWTFLAIIAGTFGGAITALFLVLLEFGLKNIYRFPYFYIILPLVLFGSAYLVHTFAPDSEGHGTEKVIEAVQKKGGQISIKSLPVKMFATLLTLIGGGSAGKEGPSISFSGGVCSWIGHILGLTPTDRKTMVICGISAGFSAVFGTPISGAIYAVEVLVLGRITQSTLFPALISGIIGFATARTCGVHYMPTITLHPGVVDFTHLGWSLLIGLFIGIVSVLLIECMNYSERVFDHIKIWKPLKGLLGGFLLLILVDSLSTGQACMGLGEETILAALNGEPVNWQLFLVKILFTSVTLAAGGSGGILMPIFFIGSTAGAFFAQVFDLNPQLFASIGMISLLAGASNTPIAAAILGVELFGMEAGTCIALAAVVSFIIGGHRSVYPTQVLANSKSDYIRIPLMREIRHIDRSEIIHEPTLSVPFINKILGRHRKNK